MKDAELNNQLTWYAMFQGKNFMRTVATFWQSFALGFFGLSIFFSFSTYFFQQVGFVDPFTPVCIVNGLLLVGCLVAAVITDKFGRRRLWLIGGSVMVIMTFCVGIISIFKQTNTINNLFIFFNCVWIVAFPITATAGGSIAAEAPNSRLRSRTTGVGVAVATAVGLLTGLLWPYMLNQQDWNWGLKTSWVFFGLGLPTLIGGYFIMPETARRSFGEIDELYESGVKPWRFAQTETTLQRSLREEKEREGLSEPRPVEI